MPPSPFKILCTFALALLLFATAPSPVVAFSKGWTGKPVVAGYYPSYSNTLTPSQIPYRKFTHIHYFVFTTTPSATTLSRAGIPESVIKDFVARAKAAGVSTSYSVGGWTGSKYFSQHVKSAYTRSLFAKTMVATMKQYGFDGIDLDWEYPTVQGIGDNLTSPSDMANFLLFLQTLRKLIPDARISCAVPVGGLVGPTGGRVTNLQAYAKVIDYLTVMSYDIFGYFSPTTGPNTPLYDTCSPAYSKYSVDSGIRLYQAAGFQMRQMLVGFPAYSYAYNVTGPLTTRTCPSGSKSYLYQERPTSTECGNWIGDVGQYLYKDIADKKWLAAPVTNGFKLYRDTIAQTVVIHNTKTGLFIPTEDATTAKAKGTYIRQKGLAGVNMFDLSGDTAASTLITNLRAGMGIASQNPLRERKRWAMGAQEEEVVEE